jgi:hypothetical protein
MAAIQSLIKNYLTFVMKMYGMQYPQIGPLESIKLRRVNCTFFYSKMVGSGTYITYPDPTSSQDCIKHSISFICRIMLHLWVWYLHMAQWVFLPSWSRCWADDCCYVRRRPLVPAGQSSAVRALFWTKFEYVSVKFGKKAMTTLWMQESFDRREHPLKWC